MIERYEDSKIKAIWSDENRYRLWEKIELKYLKQLLSKKGLPFVTSNLPLQNVEQIKYYEKETKHELVAFLKELSSRFLHNSNDAKYLHYGLTSSDIIDTASSLQIRESLNRILHLSNTLVVDLTSLILHHNSIPAIGRTHGKHAEEINFISRFSSFLLEIQDARDELIQAKKSLWGKLSGPVGTSSFVNKHAARNVLINLNLKPLTISSQIIPRYLYIKPFYACLKLMLAYERFSTLVRLSAIDEVNELQEGFTKGQTGSSAMPHKNNPIISENTAGLTRIVKANFQAVVDNTNLWWERDISHSSAERIIWPDTFHIVAHVTKNMINLINNLQINSSDIEENLYHSTSTSHQDLLEETQLTDRFSAYTKVQSKYYEKTNI
jgi:adenylosuccinate lyase